MPEVPHVAWPLRTGADGRLAAHEQGDLPEVRQCVHVALRTAQGSRPLSPDAGVPDPTFSDGLDPDALAEQLADEGNVPRARVEVTAGPVDATGRQAVRVTVALASDPDQPPAPL